MFGAYFSLLLQFVMDWGLRERAGACVSNFWGLEFNLCLSTSPRVDGNPCPRTKNNDCSKRKDDMPSKAPPPPAVSVLKPLPLGQPSSSLSRDLGGKNRWFPYFAMQNVIQSFNCMALRPGLSPISALAPTT